MQMGRSSGSIVPLKPVDIRDKYGLRGAIYAVNAARKRSGEAEINEVSVAQNVQTRILNADWEKLTLLLRDWHGSEITAGKEEMYALFEANDASRYQLGMFINDIEWAALATEFNVCIAVKEISSTDGGLPGWRIAVPAPAVFGKSSDSLASAGDASCVFLVCQTMSDKRRFIILLPEDQPVMAPGRLLIVPNKKVASAVATRSTEVVPSAEAAPSAEATPSAAATQTAESREIIIEKELEQVVIREAKPNMDNINVDGDSEKGLGKNVAAGMESESNVENISVHGETEKERGLVEDTSSNKENNDLGTILKIAESASSGKEFVPLPQNGRIELRIGDISEATILFHRVYGQPNVEVISA